MGVSAQFDFVQMLLHSPHSTGGLRRVAGSAVDYAFGKDSRLAADIFNLTGRDYPTQQDRLLTALRLHSGHDDWAVEYDPLDDVWIILAKQPTPL